MERPVTWGTSAGVTTDSGASPVRWLGQMWPSLSNQNSAICVSSSPLPGMGSPMITSKADRRSEATIRMRSSPDRKSTRLNSSHLVISYAVFCLKKIKYIYDFEDDDVSVTVKRSALADGKAGATQELALFYAAASQARGYGEAHK